MSSFLTSLLENYQLKNDNQAKDLLFNHFNQSSKPFDDLFEYIQQLSKSDNPYLINYLFQLFDQWKNQLPQPLSLPKFDPTIMKDFILQNLPFDSSNSFFQLFQLSKEYLLNLFKSSLSSPTNINTYKRTVHLIARLNYQFEFQPNELLLPLILNSKDYLIDVYLNKDHQYEEYLLNLLNDLYQNNGRRIKEILENQFHMKNVTFHARNLAKLVVRYWNLYGDDQNEKYPNLAILQQKRTLSYLINVKYNGTNDEKSMSDECWNELVGVRNDGAIFSLKYH